MLKRLTSQEEDPGVIGGIEAAEDVDLPTVDQHNPSGWGLGADSQAFLISLLFHVVLLLGLALFPVVSRVRPVLEFVASAVPPEPDEFKLVDQVAPADEPALSVGANSDSLSSQVALSRAPVLAELSEIPSPSYHEPIRNANYAINNSLQQAVGLVRSQTVVKGMTGIGEQGINGAVDRITYEILRSMEESPTLVVWFFDQSGSLMRQRDEIRDRFDKIYEELGIVAEAQAQQGKRLSDERLLTAVVAFGERVHLLTQRPTADLTEIRQAIDSIENDPSGLEYVFTALQLGIDKFKTYRSSRTGRGDARNVLFVVVSDERGDDPQLLEPTIRDCRKLAIPVYVLGVPAPFGRETSYLKYVDPDPRYDQSPQWAEVDQGPESLLPERVRLGHPENRFLEPVIDSGFGPYALSRLTYETGGIYFAIHPNRRLGARVRRDQIEAFASEIEFFFDPEVMQKYRPDYVSEMEYQRRLRESPLRSALIEAASLPYAPVLEAVANRFVKRDEAALVTALAEAQQSAAQLAPDLERLAELLRRGEAFRDHEISPRWLAAFDLALGSVLAHKVRAAGYNEMLAKARRGMNFEDAKSNTWVLKPDHEISVGSRLEKEGQQAVSLLRGVADKHQGTPWGLLAQRELDRPVGWKWFEEYTDLNPPRPPPERPNNVNPPPPRDDQRRMLQPPPPQRPLPKL